MEHLSESARTVLRARYLQKDERGAVVETPAGMFRRVAAALAAAEGRFGGDVDAFEERFYDAMTALDFLPSSPVLMNAGTDLQQLAACFVLPVEDSLESIFTAVTRTALIHRSGGGTGFSFSALRPRGDVVRSTGGVASGPVSFMKIFDSATEQIKQGGRRRGANMGVLDVSHPDIEEFIVAKREEGVLRNFNLSVGTTAAFWEAVEAGEDYDLVNPRTGAVVDSVDPAALLALAAELAWTTGDPGLLFLDRINEANPTPAVGRIDATNPCGEVPLLPYEACILGSINLAHMSDEGTVDWEKLDRTVRLAVRFLDDAIEVSTFPVPEIAELMAANRKLGVGVMGFHDMLVDLEIPYDSDEAVVFAEELMAFVSEVARDASRELAAERGPFPNWEASVLDEEVRNATTTAIAPTGTISMLAGCSSGIEPIYGVAYTKQVLGGIDVVNDRFVRLAEARDLDAQALLKRVRDESSIQHVDEVPADMKCLFRTAHDVPPERHLEIQAAFQRHVDNAVSKTVNLPQSATPDDVVETFRTARALGVKGVTVFRSGSRREQVLGTDPLKEECVSECEYVESGPAP